MNRQQAEKIMCALREFGVVDMVGIPLEDGATFWYIPAGVATWSSREPCRGALYYGTELGITCWPRHSNFCLYEGADPGPDHIPTMSRYHLWQQELYIYHLETATALQHAMEQMDKIFALPRLPGHDVNDTDPYPEDFGIEMVKKVNGICIEAIEGWLRSVPNEIAA